MLLDPQGHTKQVSYMIDGSRRREQHKTFGKSKVSIKCVRTKCVRIKCVQAISRSLRILMITNI
jgi:hypothetical protein